MHVQKIKLTTNKIHLATKVPKSQNSLTISHNNNLYALLWPVLQYLKNPSPAKISYPNSILILKVTFYI